MTLDICYVEALGKDNKRGRKMIMMKMDELLMCPIPKSRAKKDYSKLEKCPAKFKANKKGRKVIIAKWMDN